MTIFIVILWCYIKIFASYVMALVSVMINDYNLCEWK